MWEITHAVTSTKLMLEAEQRSEQPGDARPAHLHHLAPLVDAAQLEPLVLSCLRSGMKRFPADGEVKLTVLVTWDNDVSLRLPASRKELPISIHSDANFSSSAHLQERCGSTQAARVSVSSIGRPGNSLAPRAAPPRVFLAPQCT